MKMKIQKQKILPSTATVLPYVVCTRVQQFTRDSQIDHSLSIALLSRIEREDTDTLLQEMRDESYVWCCSHERLYSL